MLGAERVALSGSAPFGAKGDVDLAGYLVDVKSGRYQIPKSVERWLEAIRVLAAERSEIPILVLQPFRRKEQVVVMLLGDFARIREAEHKVLEKSPAPLPLSNPPANPRMKELEAEVSRLTEQVMELEASHEDCREKREVCAYHQKHQFKNIVPCPHCGGASGGVVRQIKGTWSCNKCARSFVDNGDGTWHSLFDAGKGIYTAPSPFVNTAPWPPEKPRRKKVQ